MVLDKSKDSVINISVKLCGRYIPPPKPRAPRGTVKGVKTQSTINYADGVDDEDTEEEAFDASLDRQILASSTNGIDVSGIELASESGASNFSVGSLNRMTTIRKVFESFNLDITKRTFADLYAAILERRDLSPA